jgi:hypothetical protein
MHPKSEGAVLPQVPLRMVRRGDGLRRGQRLREPSPPRCAMCAGRMLTTDGRGLCPECGFLSWPGQRA